MMSVKGPTRLVYKGLTARLRPQFDEEYRTLIRSYQADDAFRALVREVAEAMELVVLDVSNLGIVLAPRPGSRFAMTSAEYRAKLGVEDRGVLALIQVAVAATFFPSPSSLEAIERANEFTATLGRIRENLLGLCHELEKGFAIDPKAVPSELEEGWRIVLRKPTVRDRDDREGRTATRAGTRRLDEMIHLVLSNLVESGMLRREETQGEPFYLPTRRYKVQLRELAANELFGLCHRIANAAQTSEGPNASD